MRGISQLAFAGGLGIGRQWKWHRPGNRMPVDELAIVKLFPKHVLQSHVYDTYRYTHTHMQLHQCSGVWIFFLQFKGDSGACELARAMSSLSKLCRF